MANPDVLDPPTQTPPDEGDRVRAAVARTVEGIWSRLACPRCYGLPPEETECPSCAGTGIDPDVTLADLDPDSWPTPALVAADLHELADYADHSAAMYEGCDPTTGEDPEPEDLREARRLRALANRARSYLDNRTGN